MLCTVLSCMRGFKIPRRRRPRKCRLKSEFAFFQPLLRLFQFAYFVKCKRTISQWYLEPNSFQSYASSEREFLRRSFFSFIKREIIDILNFSSRILQCWSYHVKISCSRACSDGKEYTKKRAVHAELLFCLVNLLFFDDLVTVAVVAT